MSAHRRRRHHPLPLALLALTALLTVAGAPVTPSPAVAAPVVAPQTVATPRSAALPSPTSSALSAALPSLTPTPTGARVPTPDTEGERDPTGADDAGVQVRLVEVSPQVVRPADELVVRVTVRNGGGEALRAPQATLRVNRSQLSTRSSLEEWAGRGPNQTAGSPVASVPLPGPLGAGASADVELRVPAGGLGLSPESAAWGARGMSVELTDAGNREDLLRTFLLWLPTDEPVTPTRVSVLVPVTGGPVDPPAPDDAAAVAVPSDAATPGTTDPADSAATPGGDPAAAEPDGAASPPATAVGAPTDEVLDRLQAVVAATGTHPDVSWAVDPALLAAARASAEGTETRRWVEDLTRAAGAREVLALPARDPDLAALAHGAGAELADGAAARALRTGARTLVVGGGALSTDELTYTPTGRATVTTPGGTIAALVSDPVLTDQLQGPSDPTPAAAAQRMLAETAVVTRERPGEQRHLLLAVDREWEPEVPVTAGQLAALASAPWVDLTPLSTLVDTADPDVDRASLPQRRVADGELRPGEIAALLQARTQLAQFASVVPEPAALLAGADDAVLLPVAVAWRADPLQRAVVVDGVVDDLAARRAGVTVVPGSALNLISETGRFPLGLRNDLSQPATVQVAVEPASSLLVIDRTETVTIPAASETQVRIPFHAVGSGDVDVAVSLLAPDGTPLGPPREFTVRVRADWENVGTAVVAGLLGVALVVGIVRTIRRGQTSRRGAGSTPVSDLARLPEDPS